jgi:hypothetical protein
MVEKDRAEFHRLSVHERIKRMIARLLIGAAILLGLGATAYAFCPLCS